MLYKLIVWNGYNGMVLWLCDFFQGYQVYCLVFIVIVIMFYMINGDCVQLLDFEMGAVKGQIRLLGVVGFWKWMVLCDNVFYVLIGKCELGMCLMKGDCIFGGWSWGDLSLGYYGKDVFYGFGDMLVVYDFVEKCLFW